MSNKRIEISEYIKYKASEINTLIGEVSDSLDEEEIIFQIEEEVFKDIQKLKVTMQECSRIISSIYSSMRCKIGFLNEILADESVTEIMVNGHENIFVEKDGKIERYTSNFESEEELEEVIRKIAADVHREINELYPIVDATLQDGSRANGVYKNISTTGPTLTIRKFKKEHIGISDMVKNGTLTNECKIFLETVVRCGYNIFVSGGTSSGKTTFLNALSHFIPSSERIIIIEDSKELQIKGIPNLVQLQVRNRNSQGVGEITIADLIKTSLRMRPDRIIIGEVRGKEVTEMLQAFNTGHDGGMSTGHANSIRGMLSRLESMYLMGIEVPMTVIKSQICEGIDIFVHLARLSNGARKVIEIGEILGFDDNKYNINMLFELNGTNELVSTGNKLFFRQKLLLNDMDLCGENIHDRGL